MIRLAFRCGVHMAWLLLITAGIAEVAMAVALKAADGWTKPVPGAIGVAFARLSIFRLTHALKMLPVGTAYAAWTGLGAVGVAAVGIIITGESISASQIGESGGG